MTNGPCLCGDLYCPRCGDPAQAAWADLIEDFSLKLESELKTEEEIEIFYNAGIEAVKKYRINIGEPPYQNGH